MKATWNNQILAESDDTIVIEGNHYFPDSSLNHNFFMPGKTTTECSWKGTAHYYNIVFENEENTDAAWYYPVPKSAAAEIKNHVAFWKGIIVS